MTRIAPSTLLLGVVLAGCAASASQTPTRTAELVAPSSWPAATRTTASGSPSASVNPGEPTYEVATYQVPPGSGPHDVAPAADGGVWYTAQASGELGWLDPDTGDVREVALGTGSRPHGVIVGPDGAPWITDGGLNAIVRVDPETSAFEVFPLPSSAPDANLNTAAFDGDGVLWFTGQAGWYGRLDPTSPTVQVFPAPRGIGPYGMTATPDGDIYYSSLAGSYLGEVNRSSGEVRVIDPPTAGAGLRRVWSDSQGRLWASEWNAGQVAVYDPATDGWEEWPLPGDAPQAYAVYVDEADVVWLTDFTANAIVPTRGGPTDPGTTGRGVGRRVGCRSAGGDPDVTLIAGR
jgi:virginiamycin B lyase